MDNDGDLVEHFTFDSFGNLTSGPTVYTRYFFTGREYDFDTSLYYVRARWYDPAVGRYISEDPIGFEGGDTNFYRYVGNSPTNFTDPSGLDPRIRVHPPAGQPQPRPRPKGPKGGEHGARYGAAVGYLTVCQKFSYPFRPFMPFVDWDWRDRWLDQQWHDIGLHGTGTQTATEGAAWGSFGCWSAAFLMSAAGDIAGGGDQGGGYELAPEDFRPPSPAEPLGPSPVQPPVGGEGYPLAPLPPTPPTLPPDPWPPFAPLPPKTLPPTMPPWDPWWPPVGFPG